MTLEGLDPRHRIGAGVPTDVLFTRTFPHHAFFTDGHGIGQENLFNVLKAYSLYLPSFFSARGILTSA